MSRSRAGDARDAGNDRIVAKALLDHGTLQPVGIRAERAPLVWMAQEMREDHAKRSARGVGAGKDQPDHLRADFEIAQIVVGGGLDVGGQEVVLRRRAAIGKKIARVRVELDQAGLDTGSAIRLDAPESLGGILDPAQEDGKIGVGNPQDLGDDASGDLRGDLAHEVDRTLIGVGSDEELRQRRDFRAHRIHQLEREGASDEPAASAMRVAVRKQHGASNEVEDRTRGDPLQHLRFGLDLPRGVARHELEVTVPQGDRHPERAPGDRTDRAHRCNAGVQAGVVVGPDPEFRCVGKGKHVVFILFSTCCETSRIDGR